MRTTYYEKINELIQANTPFVSATIVDAIGSVPQDAGSKMLVTAEGLFYGTVGGGKVEKRAIEEAHRLLSEPNCKTYFVTWALDKDIGMTCGGSVKMFFEVFNARNWNVVIFGAGHVSSAVINLLVNLDCRITCIDPRDNWLSRLPASPKLTRILCQDMPSQVSAIPDDAFVVLVTMGHTTDKPILLEILRSGRVFPYVGVIGSKAKAARLKRDVLEAGLPAEAQDAFYCPMGLDIGSNHPQEIAISIVAQLIQERDRVFGRQ